VIPSGQWAAFDFTAATAMYEVVFMAKDFIPDGLCTMCNMWEDREFSRRARMHFLGETLHLSEELGFYLEGLVSEIGEALPPFKFKKEAAVQWKLREGLWPTVDSEILKGGKLALLASAARSMMGHIAKERFIVGDLDARAWGRLITYIQACFGQSFYKTERDRPRGGKRPRGKKLKEEEPPLEEVQASPTSPRYTPTMSSAQYSPTTVSSMPESGESQGRLTRARLAATAAESRYETHMHTQMRQQSRFADTHAYATRIYYRICVVQGDATTTSKRKRGD
jgi:hypothetical protein